MSIAPLIRCLIIRFICTFFSLFLGDLLTSSNSVNSRKEIISTSTGKEYVVERRINKSSSTGTLLPLTLVEED